MTTAENYEVVKVKPCEVNTSIYMHTKFNSYNYENGFSGVVRDPNLDDRFVCNEFCIWNANGDLVYYGNTWGLFKKYKLQI